MARKKVSPTTLLNAQTFAADLTDLFLKYNGILWKVRDAGAIAMAVNLVSASLSLILGRK